MLYNLPILGTDELHALFISLSKNFTESMDKGLSFNTLKAIRLNLKDISLELKSRNKR